ncbi:hypothetical protein [Microbacterium sp. Marseille-Q6648]|uniref:hypothetical protein n=1 Tax=Microbacterium sp. Marseille-Q6648 TaxID=2937991 RepID=UPI00203C4FE0|nr:hypothetical protein [Microbacterium sp. Marseille-Q6648]
MIRVEKPASSNGPEDVLLTGGQFEWTWAVPMPYRALADPHGICVMPISPADTIRRNEAGHPKGNFHHGLAYFATLQSFLTYSFGWTRHDLGLLWWYRNDRPVDDPRMALLREIWDADGMLERYMAWCIDHGPGEWKAGPGTPIRHWAKHLNQAPAVLTEADRERLNAQRRLAESGDLCASPWGMHLEDGGHIGAPSGRQWKHLPVPAELAESARISHSDPARGRATLVTEHVTGWYSTLADLGATLPPRPGGRSWRVDVFVQPIGYLGEYRHSWSTGLWFAGRHRYHAVGN